MTDIKFSLPGPETVTLSRQNVDKLIRAGDGDAALLYLYILKAHGQTSDQITLSDASTALGKDAGTIATAMAILSRLGLINKCDIHESDSKSPVNSPVEEPRQYTAHDVIRELESDSHFPIIAKEAQQKLGRILSPEDLQRLLVMYDELRLPPEVILLLITHCISESRRRGGGRMPSMRYIEKAAFEWEREGIFSMEQAEEYLKNLENLKSARGMVKTALQITERELSESQKRYVDSWIAMGFDADAIGIAYDRTMLNTNKLAWGYLDKILCSWHEKGLHTSQEILSKDSNRAAQPQTSNGRRPPTYGAGQKFGSADSDDIERMKRLLRKTKEE